MATVGLAIVAAFRREEPKPLPFVVVGLAILLLISSNSNASFSSLGTSPPISNAQLYKDATWDYGSAKDDMRGTTSKWATLYSPTELNLESPYDGDNSAHLQVSSTGWIALIVSKGQIICHSDDTVAVKFDSDSVYNYPCDTPSNGDSTTLYIKPNFGASSGQPVASYGCIAKSKENGRGSSILSIWCSPN